jgi:hypothetical protein
MKRRYVIIAVLLCLAIFSGYSQAKIFFVNLYDDWVDARLGDDYNYVFLMEGLGPSDATYMLETWDYGVYTLWFKLNYEREWWYWWDEYTEDPIDCWVDPGYSYCILMDPDGYPEFFTLTEGSGRGAQVCFLNGTPEDLTRMEIGEWWGDPVAYCDRLEWYTITNFVNIPEGWYSLYWQYPFQRRSGEYYFYPDNSGGEEIFYFARGDYALFLAYEEYGEPYVNLFYITP